MGLVQRILIPFEIGSFSGFFNLNRIYLNQTNVVEEHPEAWFHGGAG